MKNRLIRNFWEGIIMTICPNCGRQLEDGMACNCMAQPMQPQMQPPMGAPMQPPMPKPQGQGSAVVTNGVNGIIGILTNPIQGVRNYIATSTWLWSGILVAISIVVNFIFRIVNTIKYDYKVSDLFLGTLRNILYVGLSTAAMALFVYLFVTLIGNSKIDWEKAFGVATITLLITVPATIILNIWGYVKWSDNFFYTFFNWIFSTIRECKDILAVLLAFFAVGTYLTDAKKHVMTFVSAWCAHYFVAFIISYILDKIF